jgi:hypothetical protein
MKVNAETQRRRDAEKGKEKRRFKFPFAILCVSASLRLCVYLSLYFTLWGSFCFADAYDPIAVYLTWQQHPESTMTIQWITDKSRAEDLVEYRPQGSETWLKMEGSHHPMPQHEPQFIHVVELKNLKSNTPYQFRTGSDAVIYKFKTMPEKLSEPIRFVVGGDIYHDGIEYVEAMNREAAACNPHFALLGGDISYAASKIWFMPQDAQRWIDWLALWKRTMVTTDGYLIPILPVLGNHDVSGRYEQSNEQAPFFYALFATPGEQGYQVIDFAAYMSIVLLDSNHTHPVEGNQALWLEQVLAQRKVVPHKFALYHVPAYPSIRSFEGKVSPIIRKFWVPLFEKYHLTAAFENHDHAYKRSYPILAGQIDRKNGVMYIGDGAWGVKTARQMSLHGNSVWYLAKTASIRHFVLVTIEKDKRTYKAIDDQGGVIDVFTQ